MEEAALNFKRLVSVDGESLQINFGRIFDPKSRKSSLDGDNCYNFFLKLCTELESCHNIGIFFQNFLRCISYYRY
jgi:hypothetical protein